MRRWGFKSLGTEFCRHFVFILLFNDPTLGSWACSCKGSGVWGMRSRVVHCVCFLSEWTWAGGNGLQGLRLAVNTPDEPGAQTPAIELSSLPSTEIESAWWSSPNAERSSSQGTPLLESCFYAFSLINNKGSVYLAILILLVGFQFRLLWTKSARKGLWTDLSSPHTDTIRAPSLSLCW